MTGTDLWGRMAERGPASVEVDGVRLGEGSRVRLRPRHHGDMLDLALDGRVAVVEGIEQDDEGHIHLAVTVEDDPGRDLGDARMPGHRFFYGLQDVEPLPGTGPVEAGRVLVAGIGNMFLGDDGFGVEVVRRLAEEPATPGVDVVDFGIRGMDLVYALQRDYQCAIFVDAAPRGRPPGTITVLEPELPTGERVTVQTHGMDPVRVLGLARQLGGVPPRTYVVCCEPAWVPSGGPDEEVVVALSEPVRAAVDQAVQMVRSLVAEVRSNPEQRGGGGDAQDTAGRDAGAGHRYGRGAGQAVAGDPAVPEDAPDVAALSTTAAGDGGSIRDGKEEAADVPRYPR
jgi:hydrogenase maturation protease